MIQPRTSLGNDSAEVPKRAGNVPKHLRYTRITLRTRGIASEYRFWFLRERAGMRT